LRDRWRSSPLFGYEGAHDLVNLAGGFEVVLDLSAICGSTAISFIYSLLAWLCYITKTPQFPTPISSPKVQNKSLLSETYSTERMTEIRR
jgi:hypothetical protein